MEPAGGRPAWQDEFSAQTRGPGEEGKNGPREGRQMDTGGKREPRGWGAADSTLVEVCLRSLQSPDFGEEAELCWAEGWEAEGESATRGATRTGTSAQVRHMKRPRDRPCRANETLTTHITSAGAWRWGGSRAWERPGRPLHHRNTQHGHRNAVLGRGRGGRCPCAQEGSCGLRLIHVHPASGL